MIYHCHTMLCQDNAAPMFLRAPPGCYLLQRKMYRCKNNDTFFFIFYYILRWQSQCSM